MLLKIINCVETKHYQGSNKRSTRAQGEYRVTDLEGFMGILICK